MAGWGFGPARTSRWRIPKTPDSAALPPFGLGALTSTPFFHSSDRSVGTVAEFRRSYSPASARRRTTVPGIESPAPTGATVPAPRYRSAERSTCSAKPDGACRAMCCRRPAEHRVQRTNSASACRSTSAGTHRMAAESARATDAARRRRLSCSRRRGFRPLPTRRQARSA